MFEPSRPLDFPRRNPFAPPNGENPNIKKYEDLVHDLAHRFIYYRGVELGVIGGTITAALKQPAIAEIERSRHELDSLFALLRGIQAHEKANLYHGGAWQASLARLVEKRGAQTHPETITRAEVADAFNSFQFREQLLATESDAVKQYRKALELNPKGKVQLCRKKTEIQNGVEVVVSHDISIDRADIEVLINDIETRAAERMTDTPARKARLIELDRQLEMIIANLTDYDEWGVRLELKQIYLLRRLIHTTDTGHLVTVSHGTPREDLNPRRNSVDLEVDAAGTSLLFQLKTFKHENVTERMRARQEEVLERAKQKSKKSIVVKLVTEDVDETYDTSLRQARSAPTTRHDKFETLRPLADALPEDLGHRLLSLLGLTEADLVREEEEFERKQQERREHELMLAARREEALRREKELEAQAKERRRQEEEERLRIIEEQRAKLAAMEQQSKDDAAAAQRERERVAREKQARIAERQAETQAAREAREAEEAKAKAAEERRLKREAAKDAPPPWPPKKMVGLATAPLLKALGILDTGWSRDIAELDAAKKKFFRIFGKPKTKTAAAEEGDKPNDLFAELFPSKESLAKPSQTAIDRVKGL